MSTNAKVSLVVIVGTLTLLVLAVLAFFVHESLVCTRGRATPGTGGPANATLNDAEVASLSQASELLQELRQELQHSASDLADVSHQLAASRNETHTLKRNLTEQLQEVYLLTQQVFNLSTENQKLQDDLLTWKQNVSSNTVELLEAKESQEDLQRKNQEYQEKIKQLEALTHTNGSGSHVSGPFSKFTLMAVTLILLWA